MKNKKKFAFLTLAIAMGMVLGACNPAEVPSSSNASSGSADTSSTVEPSTSSSSSSESKSSSSSTSTPSTSSSASSSSSSSSSSPASSSSSSSSSVAPTAVSISVNLENVKTAYTRGEALNLTGLVVNATFSDGTSRAVHSYTTDPANGTVLNEVGEKDIVVTYKEATTSFKVTVASKKFAVKFVVDGVEVQTYEVEEGQTASYTGETPTKAPDANAVKYRFKGWDKDLTQPITADTTFTAVFAEYAASQVIDNFESYPTSNDLADAWTVESYKNNAWGETEASVVIGSKAKEGNKALRFNGWENTIGYRFLKHNEVGAFSKSANAIKFHMQVPSINTVKVILKGKATISGQVQEPSFTYEIHPTTSEYVEYVIPLAASEWQLWQQAGQTIQTAAGMIGAHVDDITNYITDVGFFVQGSDGGSNLPFFMFVDDLQFVTVDEPVTKSEVETMGQYTRYTGVLNNGYTVKVELGANNAATATVLDAPEQQQIPGTVAVDANKNMTFTSADNGVTLVYKAALKNGGQSMKFVEAGGTLADAVTGVDLNAVQVVDNFEQYTSDGTAYCQKYSIDKRSGCRGAYYSEYWNDKNTTTSPWGGNKWSLMGGEGNQLSLMTNGGHSGNQYVSMKSSQYNGMRYMQWGLFDGTAEQNNFRGSTFSFWAKTNGLVKKILVNFYSQSAPTNETRNQYVKQETFTETAAIGEWKHYEIALNDKLTYYGYMIYLDANYTADSFLFVDDVEVYTASPYATYVPPVPPVTYGELKNGQVFFANIAGYAGSTLTVKKNNAVTLNFPMMDTTAEGTYTQENDQISFDFGAFGTYVANINADSNKLEYVSATGAIQSFGEFTFNEMDVLDNAETYTESGKMYYQSNKDKNNRSGARGAYYCDWYDGGSGSEIGGSGWSLLGGSGDQLSLETTNVHSGAQSLKLRRNNGKTMRYTTWGLSDGTAEAHTGANYFMYFVKNPNATALTVRTSVYYQATVTPATQQSNRAYLESTIPANADWTPIIIPLDPAKTYYGAAYSILANGTNAGDYIYIDDAMFFSEEMNIAAPFLAIKGLEMSGALANGAPASITLGEQGKCKLTCEALGGSLDATFTLIGDKMTITVPPFQGGEKTVITGTYAPSDQAGVVTFTVISTTGEMAAYILADTVFQGSIA